MTAEANHPSLRQAECVSEDTHGLMSFLRLVKREAEKAKRFHVAAAIDEAMRLLDQSLRRNKGDLS